MRKRLGSYLEQQILSASPLEIVHLSYQCAIQAVRDARLFLAEKNIPERARCISLAHAILAELYRSLDFTAGDGKLSLELGRLYDYMMRLLLDANARQKDEPLAEALRLLCSLGEAWEQTSKDAISVTEQFQPVPSAAWSVPTVEAEQSHYSFSF